MTSARGPVPAAGREPVGARYQAAAAAALAASVAHPAVLGISVLAEFCTPCGVGWVPKTSQQGRRAPAVERRGLAQPGHASRLVVQHSSQDNAVAWSPVASGHSMRVGPGNGQTTTFPSAFSSVLTVYSDPTVAKPRVCVRQAKASS